MLNLTLSLIVILTTCRCLLNGRLLEKHGTLGPGSAVHSIQPMLHVLSKTIYKAGNTITMACKLE